MAPAYFALVIVLCHLSAIEALLTPRLPCLATAFARGPCHDCLCTLEGLYHCREVPCRNNLTEQVFVTQCQPLQVYHAGNIVCECSSFGRWRSENCQSQLKFMQIRWKSPQRKLQARVACVPRTLYVIGCNVCICPWSGLIDDTKCTNRRCVKRTKAAQCRFGDLIRVRDIFCACSDANTFLDRFCAKIGDSHMRRVRRDDISTLFNLEMSWLQEECTPQENYWIDCNNCTCDKFGSLQCTNNECVMPEIEDETIFRRKNSRFLPKLKDEDQTCTPGNTYRVHCNTCVCSAIGKLHCTTMVCWDQLVDSIEPL